MTSKAQLQLAVDKITHETGHINVMVCNAGMAPPQYESQPSETSSIQEVREYYFNTLQMEDHVATFNLNTIAVLLTTFAFIELLDAGNKLNAAADPSRPKSQVVTVSSTFAQSTTPAPQLTTTKQAQMDSIPGKPQIT